MPIPRRTFVLGALGTGALAAGAAAFSWLEVGYSVPPGVVPIALTEKQLAVVCALTEALVPGEDGLPSGLALGIPQRIDEEVWAASSVVQNDVKGALLLLEHGPLLVGLHARFTHLDADARRACLVAMLAAENGLLVQAAVALKQIVHLFTYARPEAWPAIGYAGPAVDPRPPASAEAYAALLAR